MQSIIANVLKTPQLVKEMSNTQWEMCIRQANHCHMTGRLHYLLSIHQLLPFIPPRVLNHFNSALIKTQCQQREIAFEINELVHCLNEVGIKPIFLKGAAYVTSKMAHQGRTCSDIDILVPLNQLQAAEQQLASAGWVGEHISAYDAKYYRCWMHEIPPMIHLDRKTVLDVHHHIQPTTARNTFDINVMLVDVQTHQLREQDSQVLVCTLCIPDRILHSVCHLFSEGVLHKGLRDLTDIQLMLVDYHQIKGEDAAALLLDRANELSLSKQLYLAIDLISDLFYPIINLDTYNNHRRPNQINNTLGYRVLHWCYQKLLVTNSIKRPGFRYHCGAFLIYVRSHCLKMPLRLLLPHLGIKGWHLVKDTFRVTN